MTQHSPLSSSANRRPFRAERALYGVGEASPIPSAPPAMETAPLPDPPAAEEAASGEAGDATTLDSLRAELAEMRAMLAQLCDATAESGVAADEGALDPDVAVRIEIARMVRMIGQAKSEIAQIKHPVADTNRIEDARSELDAIVQDTANATEEILAQAEAQMDLLTRLAGAIAGDSEAEALCAQVETASIKIMEACNFQDLTGQRTSKVISTLRHIEERIVAMIGIWGIEAFEELPIPEDEIEGDEALLNGPARAGEGISQADIDALFD